VSGPLQEEFDPHIQNSKLVLLLNVGPAIASSRYSSSAMTAEIISQKKRVIAILNIFIQPYLSSLQWAHVIVGAIELLQQDLNALEVTIIVQFLYNI